MSKKTLLSIVAALGFAGVAIAQDQTPAPSAPATQDQGKMDQGEKKPMKKHHKKMEKKMKKHHKKMKKEEKSDTGATTPAPAPAPAAPANPQ